MEKKIRKERERIQKLMKKGKKQTGYEEGDGGSEGRTGGLADIQGAGSLPWANVVSPIG